MNGFCVLLTPRTWMETCWTRGKVFGSSACGVWVTAGPSSHQTPTNASVDTTLRTWRTETCKSPRCLGFVIHSSSQKSVFTASTCTWKTYTGACMSKLLQSKFMYICNGHGSYGTIIISVTPMTTYQHTVNNLVHSVSDIRSPVLM